MTGPSNSHPKPVMATIMLVYADGSHQTMTIPRPINITIDHHAEPPEEITIEPFFNPVRAIYDQFLTITFELEPLENASYIIHEYDPKKGLVL